MLRNELKDKLPKDWKSKFVHRDLWDPEGYGVASFNLGGEREKVLAINFATEDIMEYFYDDLPNDEWIEVENGIKLNKSYVLITSTGKSISLLDYSKNSNRKYPRLTILSRPILIHRLIAKTFVPNLDYDKFPIVNHKDSDTNNFSKENLEWCNTDWNNKSSNKVLTRDEYRNLYIRLVDKKSFSRIDLTKEYPDISSPTNYITRSIRANGEWRGSRWKVVDLILEDYLSRHPLQEDWYQHPTMPNVRANGCGVLEIDGKLRIGHYENPKYVILIGERKTYTHRLLAECFIGRELCSEEVVDHIFPVSLEDTDNSKNNLRVGSQKDNMNNPLTRKNMGSRTKVYDLFGNLIREFDSEKEFVDQLKRNARGISRELTFSGYIVINSNSKYTLEYKLGFVYYKFDCTGVILSSGTHLGSIVDGITWHPAETVKNYLNTGMPAPDGYYYQQGDPKNMIYDPENKGLVKKREEIFWKDRDKNREDN